MQAEADPAGGPQEPANAAEDDQEEDEPVITGEMDLDQALAVGAPRSLL